MVYSYHWHVVHHKSHRRQSLQVITGAEEPAVQSFPRVSKVTPNPGVTSDGNIFPFVFTKFYAIQFCFGKYCTTKQYPWYVTIHFHHHVTCEMLQTCKLKKCPKFPHLTVITAHSCLNPSRTGCIDGLVGWILWTYGWIITFHRSLRMWLIIHASNLNAMF